MENPVINLAMVKAYKSLFSRKADIMFIYDNI